MSTPIDVNGVSIVRYQEKPIEVTVKNWSDKDAHPKVVARTTTRTVIIDPANANVTDRAMQIGDYEPRRLRTVIQVIDAPVALCIGTSPTRTPENASVAAGPAPEGRYLPNSLNMEYVFYGPDEMWLNSITGSAVTRVTVTKEFC